MATRRRPKVETVTIADSKWRRYKLGSCRIYLPRKDYPLWQVFQGVYDPHAYPEGWEEGFNYVGNYDTEEEAITAAWDETLGVNRGG